MSGTAPATVIGLFAMVIPLDAHFHPGRSSRTCVRRAIFFAAHLQAISPDTGLHARVDALRSMWAGVLALFRLRVPFAVTVSA